MTTLDYINSTVTSNYTNPPDILGVGVDKLTATQVFGLAIAGVAASVMLCLFSHSITKKYNKTSNFETKRKAIAIGLFKSTARKGSRQIVPVLSENLRASQSRLPPTPTPPEIRYEHVEEEHDLVIAKTLFGKDKGGIRKALLRDKRDHQHQDTGHRRPDRGSHLSRPHTPTASRDDNFHLPGFPVVIAEIGHKSPQSSPKVSPRKSLKQENAETSFVYIPSDEGSRGYLPDGAKESKKDNNFTVPVPTAVIVVNGDGIQYIDEASEPPSPNRVLQSSPKPNKSESPPLVASVTIRTGKEMANEDDSDSDSCVNVNVHEIGRTDISDDKQTLCSVKNRSNRRNK